MPGGVPVLVGEGAAVAVSVSANPGILMQAIGRGSTHVDRFDSLS